MSLYIKICTFYVNSKYVYKKINIKSRYCNCIVEIHTYMKNGIKKYIPFPLCIQRNKVCNTCLFVQLFFALYNLNRKNNNFK